MEEFELGSSPKQCPCCDYFSLAARGKSLVCPVCFWEDDCEDVLFPDWGATSDLNGGMTLREARDNFREYGAFNSEYSDMVIGDVERKKLKYEARSA